MMYVDDGSMMDVDTSCMKSMDLYMMYPHPSWIHRRDTSCNQIHRIRVYTIDCTLFIFEKLKLVNFFFQKSVVYCHLPSTFWGFRWVNKSFQIILKKEVGQLFFSKLLFLLLLFFENDTPVVAEVVLQLLGYHLHLAFGQN